jgi:preprotein translocase SecE subunit
VARNRKRAKERRARRPQPVPSTRRERDLDEAPDPISHATPDVELAEAQLALGRPDLIDEGGAVEDDNEPEYEPAADEEQDLEADGASGGGGGSGGATLVAPGGPTPAPAERGRPGNRLINFLQGSWRELQRVQWPDRRQVMQATGVVVGFVIVAGVFLGVADWAAGKLMNYILTGHG